MGEITASTTSGIAKAKVRRRRFLMLGVAALAVLGTILGISFTADTGSTSVSVTGGAGAGKLVYPISGASGSTMPSALDNATLQNGTIVGASQLTTSNARPSWTPAAGVPGSVTTHGDLAVIDGTSASAGGASTVQLTIYVTNLGDLGGDYTSWAFPINIYRTQNSGSNWAEMLGVDPDPVGFQYITHTLGFLSYSLPTGSGYYYDITMETGGSFYTVSTSTASGHSLSPNFYFTAQPL